MLMLAVQAADPLAIGATAVGLALAAFLSGGVIQRRRENQRNNNPNYKPGLGEVCQKHGDGISANTAAIAALGAYQATYQRNQDAIGKRLEAIQKDVTTLLTQRKE